MKERRRRIMKRLVIEELENRAMLNGTYIAMQATGLTNNSYEDFYKAQVGTEIGGAAGVGMLNDLLENAMALQARVQIQANVMNQGNPIAAFPEATTGLGQITITTGANTMGISSFAYPTAGPSRAGGTGNADLGSPTGPIEPQAADQALLELSLELPGLPVAKQDKRADDKPERNELDFDIDADSEAPEFELVAAND